MDREKRYRLVTAARKASKHLLAARKSLTASRPEPAAAQASSQVALAEFEAAQRIVAEAIQALEK